MNRRSFLTGVAASAIVPALPPASAQPLTATAVLEMQRQANKHLLHALNYSGPRMFVTPPELVRFLKAGYPEYMLVKTNPLPRSQIMELNITLAGANFRPAEAKDYIKHALRPGDKMKLVRDAENEYDERAVQIHGDYTGDSDETIFIGFVPKSDNLLLSQAMDAAGDAFEYECECTGFVGTLQPTFVINFEPSFEDEDAREQAIDEVNGTSDND